MKIDINVYTKKFIQVIRTNLHRTKCRKMETKMVQRGLML